MRLETEVLAMGQGSCNLVRGYDDRDCLVYLALNDCGTDKKGPRPTKLADQLVSIKEFMALRADVARLDGEDAYRDVTHLLDHLVVTHKDEDHLSFLDRDFFIGTRSLAKGPYVPTAARVKPRKRQAASGWNSWTETGVYALRFVQASQETRISAESRFCAYEEDDGISDYNASDYHPAYRCDANEFAVEYANKFYHSFRTGTTLTTDLSAEGVASYIEPSLDVDVRESTFRFKGQIKLYPSHQEWNNATYKVKDKVWVNYGGYGQTVISIKLTLNINWQGEFNLVPCITIPGTTEMDSPDSSEGWTADLRDFVECITQGRDNVRSWVDSWASWEPRDLVTYLAHVVLGEYELMLQKLQRVALHAAQLSGGEGDYQDPGEIQEIVQGVAGPELTGNAGPLPLVHIKNTYVGGMANVSSHLAKRVYDNLGDYSGRMSLGLSSDIMRLDKTTPYYSHTLYLLQKRSSKRYEKGKTKRKRTELEENGASIVSVYVVAGVQGCVMLTGDATERTMYFLAKRYSPASGRSIVLPTLHTLMTAPHHGSFTTAEKRPQFKGDIGQADTLLRFLAAANVKGVIVNASHHSRHGHPHYTFVAAALANNLASNSVAHAVLLKTDNKSLRTSQSFFVRTTPLWLFTCATPEIQYFLGRKRVYNILYYNYTIRLYPTTGGYGIAAAVEELESVENIASIKEVGDINVNSKLLPAPPASPPAVRMFDFLPR